MKRLSKTYLVIFLVLCLHTPSMSTETIHTVAGSYMPYFNSTIYTLGEPGYGWILFITVADSSLEAPVTYNVDRENYNDHEWFEWNFEYEHPLRAVAGLNWIDSTGALHADSVYNEAEYELISIGLYDGFGELAYFLGRDDSSATIYASPFLEYGNYGILTPVLIGTVPEITTSISIRGYDWDQRLNIIANQVNDSSNVALIYRTNDQGEMELLGEELLPSHGVLANESYIWGYEDPVLCWVDSTVGSGYKIMSNELDFAEEEITIFESESPAQVYLISGTEHPALGTGIAWAERNAEGNHNLYWHSIVDSSYYTQPVDSILDIKITGDRYMDHFSDMLVWQEFDGDSTRLKYTTLRYYFSEVDEVELPTQFSISSIYPNPFNSMATISVKMPLASELNVALFNVLGLKVLQIADGRYNTGKHNLILNAENLASGVYLVHAQLGQDQEALRKVVMIR